MTLEQLTRPILLLFATIGFIKGGLQGAAVDIIWGAAALFVFWFLVGLEEG